MSRKDEFVHRMETLRSSFEAKLGERLDELETVIGGLDMGKSSGEMKKSLENLHMLSHKLRGGAGTFGFSHVASIAQELEQLSVDGLKDIEATTPVKFLDIKKLIKSLRVIHDIGNQSTFIEEASWQIVLEELGTRKVVDNTIFLVDDDLSLAQVLEEQLTHFGFSVKIITDISDLSREVSVHPLPQLSWISCSPGRKTPVCWPFRN